jgi:hypothetical protein
MSRLMGLIALLGVLAAMALAAPAQAREPVLCFPDVPGIDSCISERFLDYWWENGGLPVFGYPLTTVFEQRTPEGTFEVQYFERQRFEYHPENARPFDVLLGRLGDEQLRRQGRDWQRERPPEEVPPPCERFPVTNQIVCGEFRSYWYAHGLNSLRGHSAFSKALHLSGLPLTEPRLERNRDGAEVGTQWFERARYESHPNNPPQYRVLLGRLGAESLAGVEGMIGGSSDGHDAARRTIRLASARDNSVTTVRYTQATTLACSDGGAVPPRVLDRPMLRLSARGSFTTQGALEATRIEMLCR